MSNKWVARLGVSAIFAMTGIASANLLTNGDFESSTAILTNGVPNGFYESADWEQWAWNDGWSELTVRDDTVGGNGTIALNTGNAWYNGGGGAHQTVAATAGQEYQLTVDSGSEAWWQPTGQMEMIWLDSGANVLGSAARFTVDPAVHGDPNDTLQPMQSFVLTGVAPVDTAFVKVEFSSRTPDATGGHVTFDNADFVAIPEPATLGLVGLAGAALLFIRRLHT